MDTNLLESSFGGNTHHKTRTNPRQMTSRRRLSIFNCFLTTLLIHFILPGVRGDAIGSNWERPGGMPKITNLEVMCGASHMEVHLNFDGPFFGLVFSKGMYGHEGCIYVPSRTGSASFVFNIYYDKCGTKPDNHGKFYENTVVVQYDEELIEAWDEAKRLRCEWFNDYEKTATKTSPMVISDLDVIELNFHGDNVDCWMEVQQGKGPWAPPLNGIVPLGTTLTMVVAVKDPKGEFDMRVKACEASDGHNGHVLPLTDPEGCVLRPKLMGRFAKIRMNDERASVLTYAFINAFKFPDMLNVHIRCTVEICRHGCPEHCQPPVAVPVHGHPNEIDGQHSLLEPIAAPSILNTHVKLNSLKNSNPTPKSLPLKDSSEVHPPVPPKHAGNSQEINMEIPIRLEAQGSHGPGPTLFPHMRAPPPILNNPPNLQNHRIQPQPGPIPQHLLFPGQVNQRPRPSGPFAGGHPLTQHLMKSPPGHPPMLPQGQRPYMQPPQRFPQFNFQHRHPPPPPPPQEQFRSHSGESQDNFHRQQQLYEEHLRGQQESQKRANVGNPPVVPSQADQIPEASSVRPEGVPPPNSKEEDPKSGSQGQDRKRETAKDDPAIPAAVEEAQVSQENRSLPEAQALKGGAEAPEVKPESVFPKGPRNLRIRRSMADNNDVIGVQGGFRVVSQADLDFLLNGSSIVQPSVVLRGRMNGYTGTDGLPIYGVCLPRVGFGIAFFGLGLATLVAILIAVFLAYAHFRVNQNLPKKGLKIDHQPPPPYSIPLVILRKMW